MIENVGWTYWFFLKINQRKCFFLSISWIIQEESHIRSLRNNDNDNHKKSLFFISLSIKSNFFFLSPRKKKISGIFHFLAHHPNKRTVDFLKINIPPAHTKKIDLLLLLFLYTAIRLEKVNLLDRWCEIIQSFLSPTAMISSILSSGNRLLFFSNEIQLFDQ